MKRNSVLGKIARKKLPLIPWADKDVAQLLKRAASTPIPMDLKTVKALRLESNRFAHALYAAYCAIERAMAAGECVVEDPFERMREDEKPSDELAKAIMRKLREDGFTVKPCQARSMRGQWRVSWRRV